MVYATDTQNVDPLRKLPRIALAHDWLVGMRGGERVLDRLAMLFGPTDLYTLVQSGGPMTPAIDACHILTSDMQHWPGAAGRLRRWYLPLYPLAVKSLTVSPEYDLLFSTSSAMIKSIKPPISESTGRPIPHICYCHSPARYLWDLSSEYEHGDGGSGRRVGLALTGGYLRRYDRRTSDRVTTYIANSNHTASRISKFYGRDSVVIHPPVRTEYFTIDTSVEREDYCLVVSALEPYKRVEIAVQAAIEAGFRLKVVGDGSQCNILKSMSLSNDNIEFLGWLEWEALRNVYRRAGMLLFPGIEDFGIVPVEAMACGCPVVAYRAGGVNDWYRPETCEWMEHLDVSGLMEAVERADQRVFSPDACRKNALRFSVERFDRAILDIVDDTVSRNYDE